MNQPPLFDHETPRQKWIREHGITVKREGMVFYIAFIGDDPDKCHVPDIAMADTEDQALINLAMQKHWELWK